MRVLPILFNTDMVRAILDGRKTVTRRLPSKRIENKWDDYCDYVSAVATTGCTSFTEKQFYEQYPPYQPGDILYVRETWCKNYYHDYGKYFYRADGEEIDMPLITGGTIKYGKADGLRWRPSIHMPKEAARIWLKVTDVRVERLQEITPVEVVKEGAYEDCRECLESYGESETQCCYKQDDECSQCDSVIMEFERLWNSTIKKSNLDRYGWDANPWVWVVEFERREKPEERRL